MIWKILTNNLVGKVISECNAPAIESVYTTTHDVTAQTTSTSTSTSLLKQFPIVHDKRQVPEMVIILPTENERKIRPKHLFINHYMAIPLQFNETVWVRDSTNTNVEPILFD